MPNSSGLISFEVVLKELRDGAYRIGVFGEFSTGKSTFLNALMGEDILSVATEPTTATPTRIQFARVFNVLVYGKPTSQDGETPLIASLFPIGSEPVWARLMKDGVLGSLQHEVATIRRFLERWTKEGQDANQTHEVLIQLPQPFLRGRVALIDTPGVNNEFTKHQGITERVLESVDLALCLVDARQGGKASEMSFIKAVAQRAALTRVVVNKIDLIDEEEHQELLEAIHGTLQGFWPPDRGPCPAPWVASSLASLDPEFRSRFPRLAEAFNQLRTDLTGLAGSQRSQRILARCGAWDRERMTTAHRLSEEGRFAEAHECLLDVLTLYQEAELEIPEELLSKIHLCEEAMKGATGEINEAHALVDRASLLLLRSDEPSEEVRTLLEHAGQIFNKNNVIDNGFNRIARIVFGPSANKYIYPNLNLNEIAIECEKLIQRDDLDNAISALEFGSAEGHVISQGLLGFSYLQKANTYKNTSIALLLHAANNNDSFAQLILGECHELGINLPKDNTKAFEYYLNSAKSGNAKAQYKLGQCYATAIGTDLNLSQAANWYRKSAEQGEVDAQIAFGLCYRFGWGVTLDHIEAVRWLEKAAASGSQEAKNTLVRWGKSLTENEILQCIMPFIPFTDFWSYPIAPEGQTKLRNAKTSCGVEPGEKVLGLLDLTVFGSAKDALLFGDKNIYFKNSGVEFKLTYVDFLYLLPETNEEAINANFLIIPTIGCLLLGSSGRPIWNIFSMLKAKLFESSITTFTEGKELFDINIKPNSEKPPESKPSETEIFNRFLKLAMIGKIDAAREVSRRYRMGIGTAQNYGQADWWELFAEGKVQL